ncbi:MAG: FG-GAP repeat protein, partial [Thermoanaerobaculia bacterium]|nr:FG-GAP repeat protein [Thermoanaerobaculia bacterium]
MSRHQRKLTPRDVRRSALGALLTLAVASTTSAVEVAKITASDGQPDDWLGLRVGLALDGDTLLASSPRANGRQGAVYVFQQDHGGADMWGEVTKLAPVGPLGFLGNYMDISGDTAVVGAREVSVPSCEHIGRAYV